jgi:hypothetical protein
LAKRLPQIRQFRTIVIRDGRVVGVYHDKHRTAEDAIDAARKRYEAKYGQLDPLDEAFRIDVEEL